MEITESFWNTPKVFYSGTRGGSDVMVFRRCPECGRFISIGRVLANMDGQIRTEGWFCTKDGEVQPHWEWVL